MTLIRNPIKTTGGVGGGLAGVAAVFALTASPSFADRDAQPIDHPAPVYPAELASQSISARCDNYFDVTAEGYVTNLKVKCGHPGFVTSSRNAVAALKFAPKIVDGLPVVRKGVVYPLVYVVMDEAGNEIAPLLPSGE